MTAAHPSRSTRGLARPPARKRKMPSRDSLMPGRRSVLASLMASALALPLAGGRAAAFAPAGPPLRRYGEFYIVNGWVLTARDLEVIGIHDR
jgi:hypothetical protein